MSNELAIQYTYEQLKDQAAIAVKSGLFAGMTPEKALIIMLKGRELGVGPMQALEGIVPISGKAAVSPQLMLALIYARHPGASVEIVSTAEGCSVTMARKDGIPHVETFGPHEAAAMGLAGKDNYKKQPATMYKWRAISACARVVFPDVIQGMYTVEELAPDTQVDFETGEVIQQHVDIDTDMRQVALPSPQEPVSATGGDDHGQPQAETPKARYSASGLRDAIMASISKRADQHPDDLVVVSVDKARKLAQTWRNIMPKTPDDLSGDKARFAITEYLIGRVPKDDKDAPSFKGLSVVEHTVLETWLSNAPIARVEAKEVWAELEAHETDEPDYIAPAGGYGG